MVGSVPSVSHNPALSQLLLRVWSESSRDCATPVELLCGFDLCWSLHPCPLHCPGSAPWYRNPARAAGSRGSVGSLSPGEPTLPLGTPSPREELCLELLSTTCDQELFPITAFTYFFQISKLQR